MRETEPSLEYSQDEPTETNLTRLKTLIRGPLFSCLAALLTLLILWPTFFYPFDRDQNTFAYVAREWNLGALPYRDTWDLKPPLIYAFYTALERDSANWIDFTFRVRVFDVVVLMLTGVLLAKIARRWTNTPTSFAAAAWYAVLVLHGGNSYLAQTETWANFCIAASILCALKSRDHQSIRWLFYSAFFAGVAATFKWPLLAIPLPFLWQSVFHKNFSTGSRFSTRHGAKAFAVLCGIFIAPLATWIFLQSKTLTQEYIALNALFVKPYNQIPQTWTWPDGQHSEGSLLFQVALMALISTLWVFSHFLPFLFALIGAWRKKTWREQGRRSALLWILISFAIVLIQRKFLSYHWMVVLPGFALLSAAGVASLMRNKQTWGGVLAVFVALGWIVWQRPTEHRDAFLLTTGNLSPNDWVMRFPNLRPEYASLQTAHFIAQQTKPSDSIFVWGFEPQIYLMSGRRAPTRFFYNLPVSARYAPKVWRDELLHDLKDNPPQRLVVVSGDQNYIISGLHGDSKWKLEQWPELNLWLQQHYQREKTLGRFMIYQPKNRLQ